MSRLLCGLIALLAASCVAWADNVFNNEAAWAAALTGGPTTVNFEGVALPAAPGNFNSYGYGSGSNVTVGGVNFAVGPQGTDNILFIIGDNYYGQTFAFLSPQPTNDQTSDVLITPPGAVTALGFDFGGAFAADTATVTLSDGFVQSVPVPGNPNLVFFGVTAPGGITSVDITLPASGGYAVDVADVSYGTAAAPEPSSVILLSTMLLAVAFVARKRMAQGL